MDKDLSTARDLWIVTVGKVEDSQLTLGEYASLQLMWKKEIITGLR